MKMRFSIFFPLIPLLSVVAAIPEEISSNLTCLAGVYIIGARATNIPPGEGHLISIANRIQSAIPLSTNIPLVYPAVRTNYPNSEHTGVKAMKSLIKKYVKACGDKSNIVLMGYSQGAQVVADTLSGSCENFNRPLGSKFGQHIKGIILMGDPSRVNGQSYCVGNATVDGIFKRSTAQIDMLNSYAGIMQSYCDAGDEYCDSGPTIGPHRTYVGTYGVDAANFIINLVAGSKK